MILKVVKARTETTPWEKDLLQMILEAAESYGDSCGLPVDISPSKFIGQLQEYTLLGHETTALSASWCLMLLSMYPEWQARVRSELNMVIQETLRLYYPVAFVVRETLHAMDVRGIQIPKGINLQTYGDLMYTSSNQKDSHKELLALAKFPRLICHLGLGLPSVPANTLPC
ncbi:hypothetical protein RHGRI_019353 [Rhododendron griersonianum]|uniref:Cytochrome P450 n=1 Tax=Rhododendron griersonianum TaxID=479676 RepID=A0AAV6JHN5_9ERIC|nr:hypothetical protein RHGRI_019353 [Rhododendron griersonianum]